jgi:hypothetical protein
MRIRLASVLAGLAVAGAALVAGSTPAMAAPSASAVTQQVRPMASTTDQVIHFYNDGWYYAYADVWGYDANGKEIYHDWSGDQGHGGNRWFTVPAGVASVVWQVRMEPFGNTIHQQLINPWYNFNDFCRDGKHATIYVGGLPNSTNSDDLHCSNW